MGFLVEQLAEAMLGDLVCNNHPQGEISSLLIDSRKLTHPQSSIFFALVTHRNDGHLFIRQLFAKGLRNFVVSKPIVDNEILAKSNIIQVPDTLVALQNLGAWHRAKFTYPVIGITGSNGKTIVKEWLRQLIGQTKTVVASPRSFNSQIGVPLSVWQMGDEHSLGIFEAGISLPHEMRKLEAILKPDIGIFTNIGQAHAENFKDQNHKIADKLQLFEHCKFLIYCSDQVEVDTAITKTTQLADVAKIKWGLGLNNSLNISNIKTDTTGTTITAIAKPPLNQAGSTSKSIFIPFTDKASIENAIHCWAYMLFDGYGDDYIVQAFQKLHPVEMRMELKQGINHCSLINDSYSSDLNSLSIALDFLAQQLQYPRKTVILSDIQQSGLNDDLLYKEVAFLLASKSIDRIIGIGKAISAHRSNFPSGSLFFPSTAAFIEDFHFSAFHNETILLKGARDFEFEQIGRLLQQKLHETVLEINLNALVYNLNYYRSTLPKGTKTMAMVKAFSYGSGGFEIANALQYNQVDYLAVAYIDEGVELRKAGITLPIMVMNAENDSLDALFKWELEPEVYSFKLLNQLLAAFKSNFYGVKTLNIHLKFDTGMHRLGFTEDQLPQLIQVLESHPEVNIVSVFSHLAGSDDPTLDDFTRQQIACFERIAGQLDRALGYKPLRHLLNSSGIVRFPEASFDMVRLGIGLYGIANEPETLDKLQNVSVLKTVISQIKTIAAGETIGYSRKWFVAEPTTIAIIPVGYADGLDRRLSNGKGYVKVNGHRVPIIGNISMDMCSIDITNVQAKEGDAVIVFDSPEDIKIFADSLETIPYEVITGISQRVKRVYLIE